MQNQNSEDVTAASTPIPITPEIAESSQVPILAKVLIPGDSVGGFGTSIAISIMVSLIICAGMLVAYDHFVAKKFISVDVKGFVEEQQTLFISGKITNEQLQKNYAELGSIVKAIPKNRVVLMGDAVLGGIEKIDVGTTAKK